MKKKLFLNTFSSILFQITTIVCGFVLPRLILKYYGSEVNGLVSSIGHFLALISFVELGVGTVLQASFYKPLANNDRDELSRIASSGDKFFRRIAYILVVYIAILVIFFPLTGNSEFDWIFTVTLILSMSISSFAQYYFGIVDRILLTADQRGFIQYTSQTITLIVSTLLCVLIIKIGGSIQIVKLTTSIVFVIRPIILRIYVKKRYSLNRRIKTVDEPIKQKWNGVAQHVAAVILLNTDVVVLTLFSTFSNVSIYSVYILVINGIENLILSTSNGVESLAGNLMAKGENDKTKVLFGAFEFMIHTITSLLFTVTFVLIIPFIKVYTSGIDDANYIQPLFCILLVVAHGMYCLRIPYHTMIKAGGHFKQTQICYILSAVFNVGFSIIAVFFWQLIGVAIGTLVAMLFQTIWMIIYNSKKLVGWSLKSTIKQFAFDLMVIAAVYFSTFWIKLTDVTYYSWVLMAVEVSAIALVATFMLCILFYKKQTKMFFHFFRKKLHKGSEITNE